MNMIKHKTDTFILSTPKMFKKTFLKKEFELPLKLNVNFYYNIMIITLQFLTYTTISLNSSYKHLFNI